MTPEALRLLLVHAHPDDETLTMGATIAAALDHGHRVVLVTCTRGEEGEVIGAAHAHRTSARDDTLGTHRETELADALAALAAPGDAVVHHWLDALPGDGRRTWPTYRDSGMAVLPGGRAGVPPDVRPDAFAVADLDEAADRLARLVSGERPHVVLTYDEDGGYGHPDHVMAHRVALRAVELAADAPEAPWDVPLVLAAAGDLDDLRAWLRAHPDPRAWDPTGPLPHLYVAPERLDAAVPAQPWLPRKVAALRALPTQVTVEEPAGPGARFVLSNDVPQPLSGLERYRLLRPVAADAAEQVPRTTAADPLAALTALVHGASPTVPDAAPPG
ncbi:N-acetyl-1-D-myo-inositol-2-amino-2-deoxy-alpha-D-glucopyranoside deacetylase [Aquipuribacter nitratireducens]|uniref:N-acetyl-1-D-myo-inositol-2-amino-2-deoxy-alpha-D-glucopyranoside deacetylase n=1 Tax=Aquipuribacter nitratireducens TaxID=650104 RepID=A0ABW0GP56_9MICO